jgi:hypothetical protein
MKNKDLWDMRDLPLPSREEKSAKSDSRVTQSVRPSAQSNLKGGTISLTEWGENGDFWKEWKDEFRSEDSFPQFTTTSASTLPAPVRVEESVESHENDAEIFMEPWSTQIAFHERRMEKEGTADYGVPFRRQELLAEKTKEFARQLQHSFRKHIEQFNLARKSAAHSIHIYKISRSDEDFLVYRNGVKLIISAQRAGIISLSFNQFIAPVSQTDKHAHVELEALWGPFDQLLWTYKGERIQLLDIVRYFLSEIAFQSFR